MDNVRYLECINCGSRYAPDPRRMTCSSCGPEGLLDVVYDYDYIRSATDPHRLKGCEEFSIWRYLPFLPVEPSSPRPFLKVGWTPLYSCKALARELGLEDIMVKDDGLNPTGSLKDRASAIAVVKAAEAGAKVIACASTGNAASSLAGNAASLGFKTCIFVPQRAPQGKLAQLLIYGATVVSVQGSYQDAFELSARAIEKWGWYNRNAAINPYLVEGKKTVSLEVCEQLGWQVPDWAVFSVGDGCTIAGAWKGFSDLYRAGFIPKTPKMAGVQAEGCNPISRAFHTGGRVIPLPENTIADSIAVGTPRNPVKALRAVTESGGTMVDVSDTEILEAMRLLGQTTGIFGEPAGVAGLAGIKKLVASGVIQPHERVVLVVTGNGLKDVANAIRAAGEPISIPPSLEELTLALRDKALFQP